MNFEIKKLPHEPIIFASMNSAFRVRNDYPAYQAEMHSILDQQREPVFYVLDVSTTTFDLDELISIVSGAARGSSANFHHPNVRQVILISRASIHQIITENMKTDVYGRVAAVILPTVDEALAYARSQ
jgi:hypothetical protein